MLNDNLAVGVEGMGALNFLSEKTQTDPKTNFSLWYGGKAVSDLVIGIIFPAFSLKWKYC